MKKIWIFIAKLFGWKFDELPEELLKASQHAVVIMAPHTSIADFFAGAACCWKYDLNARIFMKKEFFNFLTRPMLEHFGVVAVDRGNIANGLVAKAVNELNSHEKASIVITPEGTRKPVKRWKRGFYEIATQANVPIVCSYIDFKERRMGYKGIVYPTGDYAADLPVILRHYAGVHAKHPEKFILGEI